MNKGYIVYNTDKPFSDGHTHLRNFNTARLIANLAGDDRMPYHLNEYLLISLMRVSNNVAYQEQISLLLENKRAKCKQKYSNFH